MAITQLSVFLDNKPGKLAGVLRLLKERNINMRALSLAETADYGILRLIVSDIPAAENVLKETSAVTRTPVTAVRTEEDIRFPTRWGEMSLKAGGYLLLQPDGEIYGVQEAAFSDTYRRIDGSD